VREVREVEARGHLRGGERAEPDARLLARLADLRHPHAPAPPPHAAVRRVPPGAAPPARGVPFLVAGFSRR
jgi:hypothetical protein